MTPIEQARQWILEAPALAILTGAGISAESGIPTFRGASGMWNSWKPEELATPQAFHRNPRLVWEWYQWRRGLVAAAEPNAGHRAIAAMGGTLITQNVDDLHERAGSGGLLKIHGDIWLTSCVDCTYQRRDRSANLDPLPPVCGECGGLLRPGVVWFGEGLPHLVWGQAQAAVQRCGVLLVAGTSAQVYPAAQLIPLARQAGARVIEVNLEETPYSAAVDLALRGSCGELLPMLAGLR